MQNGDEKALVNEAKRIGQKSQDNYLDLRDENPDAASAYAKQIKQGNLADTRAVEVGGRGGIKNGLETTIVFNKQASDGECTPAEMTVDPVNNKLKITVNEDTLAQTGCVTGVVDTQKLEF